MVFCNERYISGGVEATISADVCAALWLMVDGLKATGIKLSSYQFFTLSVENGAQKVVHSQEQPDYTSEVILQLACPAVKASVYAIDNGDYSAMILSSEY